MRRLSLHSCLALAVSLACGGGGSGSGEARSSDATLSVLAVSAGALDPAFTPDQTLYTLTVPPGTATVTVTPTAADASAQGITVGLNSDEAVAVASGAASRPLAVPAAGTYSKIYVIVTAEDGTTAIKYVVTLKQAVSVPTLCATSAPVAVTDGSLPAEPTAPGSCADLQANITVSANGLPGGDPTAAPPDTTRIQAAIDGCASGSVRLLKNSGDATKVAFVSGPLTLRSSVTLYVDQGVTLFASRRPRDYDPSAGTATCAVASGSSSGCLPFIKAASTTSAGIMGRGVIDGLGGEPMVGGFDTDPNASWWEFATLQSDAGRSFSNPRLVDVTRSTGFTLSRITLRNSPKFHVGLESDPFLVYGVTIQTPSRTANSVGRTLTPHGATNTDGIDPYNAGNGYIVFSTISTGDDQIALKCGDAHVNTGTGASCQNIVIAHNHFGTGHGMSIGSETNAGKSDGSGVGVDGLHVYDLSIDGLLPNGNAGNVNLNGIRIKSDATRGGVVKNVLYEDVCMRGLANPILLNPKYSSTAGPEIPTFQNITVRNVRHVDCATSATVPTPVVTLNGYDGSHVSTVTLDGVYVEAIQSANVKASNATVTLGPGMVNFAPSGTGVTVNDVRTGSTYNGCAGKFVALPSPQ